MTDAGQVPEAPAVAHALLLVEARRWAEFRSNVSPGTRRDLAAWLRLHPDVLSRAVRQWVEASVADRPHTGINGPRGHW